MKPLLVPHGVLVRYPLSVPTVVAALWELYMVQTPPKQLKLTFAVEPLLQRLGKEYGDGPLRELEEVLRAVYRLQKIGYTRQYVEGVDTITVWLTPDIIRRVHAYQETLRESP